MRTLHIHQLTQLSNIDLNIKRQEKTFHILCVVDLLNKTRINNFSALIQFFQLPPQTLNQSVQLKNKLSVEFVGAILKTHVNKPFFLSGTYLLNLDPR